MIPARPWDTHNQHFAFCSKTFKLSNQTMDVVKMPESQLAKPSRKFQQQKDCDETFLYFLS